MTDDSMVPEWMRKKQEERERSEAERMRTENERFTAAFTVSRKAPQFWQSLKEKLHISVHSLDVLKLTGSFSSTTATPNHVHIEVLRPGNFPNISNADIHFDSDAGTIRATGLIGAHTFPLVARYNEEVGAQVQGRTTAFLNSDSLAEHIMRLLVDQAERSH